jgi:hypothetical protein
VLGAGATAGALGVLSLPLEAGFVSDEAALFPDSDAGAEPDSGLDSDLGSEADAGLLAA